MNLRRLSLAGLFLISFGASRLHATVTFTYSSITYCAGATAVPTNGQSPVIYTTNPSWYVGVSATSPGLMGGSYPRQTIAGTQALLHLDGNGTDSSGVGHTVNPTNASTPGNPCVNSDVPNMPVPATPGAAATSWPAAQFSQGLGFTGNFAGCCIAATNILGSDYCTAYGAAWNTAYAQVQGLDTTFTNKSFSVELWVRTPGSSASTSDTLVDAPILSRCTAYSDYNCMAIAIRDGKPYFNLSYDSAKALVGTAQTWAWWNAGWHHLAFTFDATSRSQNIYVDGTLDVTQTAGNTYQGSSAATYLGINPWISGGDSFGGTMDDIRILNYEMTGSQVASDVSGQAYYYSDGTTSRWYPYWAGWGTNWGLGNTWAQFNMNLGAIYSPTSNVSHAVQDADEVKPTNYALSISINQSDLILPPEPHVSVVGSSSITWSWANYQCNSPYTTYNLTTNAGTPGVATSSTGYGAGSLTPNTLYNLSLTATYVDTGGSGTTVGPSGASPVSYARTLAAAPAAAPTVVATGPNSVDVTMNTAPNPAATSCQIWAKRNGSYVVVSAYQATTSGVVRPVSNLARSSNYIFSINCRNDDGVVAARGPESAPAPTFISQPAAPASFSGATPADPLVCPKTSVVWSWSPVNQGSDYPTPSSADTPYRVAQISSDGGTLTLPAKCSSTGATTCTEKNLLPNTFYLRVAQAYDGGASWGAAVWSDTSTMAGVTTMPNFTDQPTGITSVPGSNMITWSWTRPSNVCVSFQYDVYDAVTSTMLPNGRLGDMTVTGSYPAATYFQLRDVADTPLATNTLYSVRVVAIDTVSAPSGLSASASAYTLADAPTNLRAASISTHSMLLQWDSTNPPYTRFEVSMSPVNDLGQPFSFSTLTYISNNWTAKSLQVNGLASGSTYYFRVRAASGRAEDSYGGLLSNFAVLASTITGPAPPPLSGTGTSTSMVQWTWSYVTGARGYKLVSDQGVVILDNTNTTQTTISSGPFLPNTACAARIAAYNSQQGLGPYSPTAYAFTLANTPVVTPGLHGIVSGSTNAVTLSWSPNGNSAFTFYEIVLATDPAFGVIAATVSAQSTFTVISGLFPGATYYARVRAINGAQQITGFIPAGSGGTSSDPYVTRSSAPVSPYLVAPGLVGLWHFDESSGTVVGGSTLTYVGDSTMWHNSGLAICLDIPAVCSVSNSTPALTADALAGLGRALSFSGMRNTLLRIPDAAQYDAFAGDLTVSLWAKPASAVQPDGTALAAKGAWNDESFSLELALVSGAARYRWRVRLAGGGWLTAVSTAPARVGVWDLVTGVFDAGASRASLYVNGAFVSSAATGGLLRVVNAEPVSLGNRKDAGGAYNLGYSGVLDDLRLVNGALSAAAVADLYRSYIPAGLVPSGSNSGIQLLLPPDAFDSAAVLYISADPVSHPLRIPYSLLAQALARTPTGQMLVPTSQAYPTLVEIVPTLDGVNYYNGPLGSSAVLSMAYADVNGDRVVDGTSPPIPVSRLQLYALESNVLTWTPLPTTIDLVSKRVSAPVPHFSLFALFGATAFGPTVASARVYPVPWIPRDEGRFGGDRLTFADLPRSGSIRILTLSGERVIDLDITSADAGIKQWDGRNESGKTAASGVYFARVDSSQDGSSRILRFAIER